jgi:outer membrane protein
MKNISTLLSVLALALIAILYFLFFSRNGSAPKSVVNAEKQPSTSPFKIAYFEIDSLEANYSYFKDVLTQVKSHENAMNAELSGMEKSYQKKITEWQQKANKMSQAESEQVQREYATMQQTYQSRKQALQEDLYKQNEDLKSTIKKKIEVYLKVYNKDRNYSYIFAYEPNSFMYYQDTTYNITRDLINGLNANYKPAK